MLSSALQIARATEVWHQCVLSLHHHLAGRGATRDANHIRVHDLAVGGVPWRAAMRCHDHILAAKREVARQTRPEGAGRRGHRELDHR